MLLHEETCNHFYIPHIKEYRGHMKKCYQRDIVILLLTLSLTGYLVLVYQNYEEAKAFNAWYDSFLESSHENIPEKEDRDLCIEVKKSGEAARYISEVLIAEMEDIGRVRVLPVLTLRARSISYQKMARETYTVSYIGKAFIAYKSSHSGYRSTFEEDHGIAEWNEDHWTAFLVYLKGILSTASEIEEMVPSEETLRKTVSEERDREILRGFYERTIERYKTTMNSGRSDKALFEYELLKTLNDQMTGGTFFPPVDFGRSGYLFLIKDSMEFIIPVSLLIWIGYLIGYALLKQKDIFASMEKKRQVVFLSLGAALLVFLILISSLTTFLLVNDKRLLVIRSSALRDTGVTEEVHTESIWEMLPFWEMDGAIETRDIAALESFFNEILSEERYMKNEEIFRAQAIDTIKEKEPYPVFPYFSTVWKVGGVYILVIPKEFLSMPKKELSKGIESIKEELESQRGEIITLCENGEVGKAKERWRDFSWNMMLYEGMREGYIHTTVLTELALLIL